MLKNIPQASCRVHQAHVGHVCRHVCVRVFSHARAVYVEMGWEERGRC